MSRRIHSHRLRVTDPRLGRHVRHDPKSWGFAFPTQGLTVAAVRWYRYVPVFDQGKVRSCTGNAGIGALCTGPLWPIRPSTIYTPDEAGALRLYSGAETLDGDGPYPPEDNGSSGLSVAKVLTAAGMIPGYRHTFSLDGALKALTQQPLITGINWYADMFHPSAEGIVKITGDLAGGHETVVDEYDPKRGLVGFTNSWGQRWGLEGRFYLAAEDYGELLRRDGDVTVLLPPLPAPPTPTPPAPGPAPSAVERALAGALRTGGWVAARHWGTAGKVARAGRDWLIDRGL